MQLINRTRVPGHAFVDLDRHGAETLVVVLKAAYDLTDARPALARKQNDLVFTDVFAGEPGQSSLLYESDANWGRTGTDIAFLGHAYPRHAGDRETDVLLRVGSVAKSARVFGDRHWTRVLGLAQISDPEPFERMPLVYERAFGGVDDTPEDPRHAESEPRNPVGRGLRAHRSRKAADTVALPNIEDERQLIGSLDDRPAPVGFTFVAKHWQARSRFVGTYDEAWQRTRMPLLPEDFDPRFHAAASPGLGMASCLQGGEPVTLVNLTPARQEQFALPAVDLSVSFAIDAQVTPVPMRLDNLVIDTVHGKLLLVWHGSHPVHGQVDDINWVLAEAGHA
jgi:hypothetical protein